LVIFSNLLFSPGPFCAISNPLDEHRGKTLFIFRLKHPKHNTMKPRFLFPSLWALIVLMGALLIVTCNKDDEPTAEEKQIEKIIDETPVDPYTIAMKLIDQAGWPLEEDLDFELGDIQIQNYQREVVYEDIVHYSFQVAVGTHQYDKMGIHRVVKEATAGQPLLTEKTFFYQHGDLKNFVGMMLPCLYSPSMPDDRGLAIYLAQNGVDVWGIDQAWCAVPLEATDFTWFKDYGLEKTARDLRSAMAVARVARYLTGNSLDKMIMAGYSSGISEAYVACDMETQLDQDERHIKALVAIEQMMKPVDDTAHLIWVNDIDFYKVPYDAGIYQATLGFTYLTSLARTDPDGISPVFPDFTNLQVILYFGCAEFYAPWTHLHYWASDWVDDFPATPKYTTLEQILDFTGSAIEYQPNLFEWEYDYMVGDLGDSPYDDHFAQITIPIFTIAAAGGMGAPCLTGSSNTGSTDTENLFIQLEPDGNEKYDFGHVDIFTAYNAEELMWLPLLNWLNAH